MMDLRTSFRRVRFGALIATVCVLVTACAIPQMRQEQAQIAQEAEKAATSAPPAGPVVRFHEGAWLLGEKIRASKPQPDIFDREISWTRASTPSLSDVAAWIARTVGVRAVVDASVSAPSTAGAAAPAATPAVPIVRPTRAANMPILPAGLATTLSTPAAVASPNDMPLKFRGTLRSFLNVVDANYGVWSQYRDGTVTFLRTETRVYTLPTLPDTSMMTGTISTGDSGSSGGGSSGGMPGGGATSSTSSSSSGSSGNTSQSTALSLQVSPMATLKETAASIAGAGATVVVDPNLGMLTVTGTPPQCDRVEAWMKKLNAMFGKQIAIDVHIYQVRRTNEENYGLNLALAYKSKSGHTGISFASTSAPTVLGSATPMTFGATILSGPLAGSTAAIQALSTLGNVSEVISRSGVTQNGKLLALQSARSQGYVTGSTTTLAASVGSSTAIQTGVIVPGFTSSFVPKVADGRILIDFDMTLSDLLGLQTFTSGSGSNASSAQLPTMNLTRFQQSVSLKPGETLVLTGMRQIMSTSTNNGIGSPYMALLGGGIDAERGDTILAIVITARLL